MDIDTHTYICYLRDSSKWRGVPTCLSAFFSPEWHQEGVAIAIAINFLLYLFTCEIQGHREASMLVCLRFVSVRTKQHSERGCNRHVHLLLLPLLLLPFFLRRRWSGIRRMYEWMDERADVRTVCLAWWVRLPARLSRGVDAELSLSWVGKAVKEEMRSP